MKSLTVIFLVLIICAAQISAQKVELLPVAKGFAKNSINTVIFRQNSVTSWKNTQFISFYDETSHVMVGKRQLNSKIWQIVQTPFTANTSDAHNAISLAVDGQGFLHISWGMHNAKLKYARSKSPESLDFSDEMAMIGDEENRVTYPQFFNLPSGNLLFFYRDGSSGNGNLVLNEFDVKQKKWRRIQNNLIDGEGVRNAYPQMSVDAKGTIHVSWVWRETPDVATNHDLCYARSTDGGKTWKKSNGEEYSLPINSKTAELAWKIPNKSELINQTSMTANKDGKPFIATYWRDVDSQIPQFRIVYFDGAKWNAKQISDRKTAFSLSGSGTKRIPISRPKIIVDGKKIVVIFRDEERGSRVSAYVCDDIKKCVWKAVDLTDFSVEMWEPTLDDNLWNKTKMLNLLVQKVGQGDGEKSQPLEPQQISILKWKPKL